MKTRIIIIYSIEELSEEAQQKAHEDFLNNGDFYFWGNENKNTLEEFCNIFPVKVKDWEYGYHNFINWEFTGEDNIKELTGVRLLKYIYNNFGSYIFKQKYFGSIDKHVKHPCFHNKTAKGTKKEYSIYYSRIQKENCCVLTGYCIDDDILQPIYEFLKKPNNIDFEDLLNKCLHNWVFACNADYEYSCSMEYFIEHCQANDYEFTEDGKLA